MDGGNGVEEGTAGDEEGLDYHWAVIRQNHRDQLLALSSVVDGEMTFGRRTRSNYSPVAQPRWNRKLSGSLRRAG